MKTNVLMLAVRVGFEPTEPVKVQRFSRPPDSTALAPHRVLTALDSAVYKPCSGLSTRHRLDLSLLLH